MRRVAVFLMISGGLFAQSMVEFGAAAAAGTVGGASGKSVSQGVNSIFGKINGTMDKASAADKAAPVVPAMKVSAGVARDLEGPDPSGVPAPPPVRGAAKPAPVTQAQFDVPAFISGYSEPLPTLPPPPTMSREGLQQVGQGMTRTNLLHLGAPSSKLSMFEEGHLIETYSYKDRNGKFGTVQLKDGAVATVTVQ